MNENDLITFNAKIERNVKEQFKEICKRDGKKIAFEVNVILKEYIERHTENNNKVKVG